ncbi:MAG: hypothetical protein DMG38_08810 [Acidobacteria bacterium]|nr:MAG: hypothetical protein DMG38_08810 [Acidobacteriota bacterium]
MDLAEASYKASAHFPHGERFGLVAQIQRAALARLVTQRPCLISDLCSPVFRISAARRRR